MHTLSQRLGSFPESRVENFSMCRQDYPLRYPINRVGFHALEEKKIRSKVSQKISFFPISATFSLYFSLSVSVVPTANRSHHHSHQHLFHHNLHHKQLLDHLMWWSHDLSLSPLQNSSALSPLPQLQQ